MNLLQSLFNHFEIFAHDIEVVCGIHLRSLYGLHRIEGEYLGGLGLFACGKYGLCNLAVATVDREDGGQR